MPLGHQSAIYSGRANTGRLVYIHQRDAQVRKNLVAEFAARGFQVMEVPDSLTISALIGLRCPDIIVCGSVGEAEVGAILQLIGSVRKVHLGIACFLLVGSDIAAESVSRLVRAGARLALGDEISPVTVVSKVESDLREYSDPAGRGASGEALRFTALTAREKQILQMVAAGGSNKAIADDLSISHRTVEVHRSHLMKKLGAKNTADLVRMCIEG